MSSRLAYWARAGAVSRTSFVYTGLRASPAARTHDKPRPDLYKGGTANFRQPWDVKSDMTDTIAPFLGTWMLDLDESEFDQSDLPRSATCTIEEEFGLIRIRMITITADGERLEAEIAGVPGGPGERLGESGLADRLLLFFEDETTLTSQAKRGDMVLMSARRMLSEDGRTLEIEQSVEVPGEGTVVNTGIYRRAQ